MFKFRLKKGVKIILVGIVFVSIVGFVENRYNQKICNKIEVILTPKPEYNFIGEEDILRLISYNGKETILGSPHRNINVKKLEERIKGNVYVNNCQVARSLKGDLKIELSLVKPIARFVRVGKPDFYVDSTGKILPVIDKVTARCLVITFTTSRPLPDFANSESDQALLTMLKYITNDPFLRAQIAQIKIDSYGFCYIYPQVGNQSIEFGGFYNFRIKFDKLKTFYQKILPIKGWNTYKRISLQYENQIICE
jgi:cell division protein FtsQ